MTTPMMSPSKLFTLEIRDFPRAIDGNRLDKKLPRRVLRGLKNCVNLRSCAWTRDSSLTSNILEALHQCKNLRDIELNGQSVSNYDPRLLLGFTELQRISLVSLSPPVVRQFKPWLSATGASLRSLTLLCKVRSQVVIAV